MYFLYQAALGIDDEHYDSFTAYSLSGAANTNQWLVFEEEHGGSGGGGGEVGGETRVHLYLLRHHKHAAT